MTLFEEVTDLITDKMLGAKFINNSEWMKVEIDAIVVKLLEIFQHHFLNNSTVLRLDIDNKIKTLLVAIEDRQRKLL